MENDQYDSEELQLDECNTDWVDKWKRVLKKTNSNLTLIKLKVQQNNAQIENNKA